MNGKKRLLLGLHTLHGFAFIILSLIFPGKGISQSLLWKISGNDGTNPSYLFGTIYLKDNRAFEWKDTLYNRISLCSAFAGEIDLNPANIMKAAALMVLPGGQTLHDRFTPEEYELVQEAVRLCSGYELSVFDNFKPIALIALCYLGGMNSTLEATVDELLYQKAVKDGKTTIGLETVEEQAALVDKVPDSYVIEYFSNLDEQNNEFEKLIRCYQRADLDSIWILLQEEESGVLLNDELIRLRNYRMTERIIPIIRRQSTFIAIGSGHLPGEEGVIALLRKEGFVVEAERLWCGSSHHVIILPLLLEERG
jgi:uncharacterized protein YbaP (TraB family)